MDTISEELNNLLSEFHKISMRELRNVWHVWTDQCLDKILFEFDEVSLAVEAEIDYDTVLFSVIRNNELNNYSGVNVSKSELWTDFIGKAFGWGWVTINQQNYLDGILLSFDGIKPNILLNVIASSITLSITHQIADEILAG